VKRCLTPLTLCALCAVVGGPSTSALVEGPSAPDASSAACDGGDCAPQVVVQHVSTSHGLVIDDGSIHWAEGPQLRRCAVTGCGAPSIAVTTDADYIGSFTIADAIYYVKSWSAFGVDGGAGLDEVWRADKGGGHEEKVATVTGATAIAAYGSQLLIAVFGDGEGLYTCPLGVVPCTPARVASAAAPWLDDLIARDEGALWATFGGSVYVWSSATAGIVQVGKTNPPDTTPLPMAIDGATAVWWDDRGGKSTILAASLTEPVAREVTTDLSAVLSLGVDGDSVYASTAEGRVVRVPLAGGAIEPLATTQAGPTLVTTDSTAVYWFNRDAHTIMRRGK
jgi:hypothetical protein